MGQSNQQEIVIEPESDNNMFVYTLYVIFTSQTAMLNIQNTHNNHSQTQLKICRIFDCIIRVNSSEIN